jgi:mono/diheme cytochrome c family protein
LLKLRRPRWLTVSMVVFLVPAFLIAFASVALAQGEGQPSAQPSSAAGQTGGTAQGALPGDPNKGQQLVNQSGCTTCHGGSLTGGIGPSLDPIKNLGDTKDPLDPNYLIDTITNGKNGVGGYGQMPAKGGNSSLKDQDIKDIAAYIIKLNKTKGPKPLDPHELAISNVEWVTLGILAMLAFTYLLARYNMRWIGRKAARTGRG